MNLRNFKDVAELVALVALVGSLIAVTVELRQTQSALESQTYQDRAFDAIAWHLEVARNPHFHALGEPGFDLEELSETEYVIALNLAYTSLIDLDNEHYQYQRGFLEEAFYQGDTVKGIRTYAPIWRAFGIEESRPEFRKAVDDILSMPPD